MLRDQHSPNEDSPFRRPPQPLERLFALACSTIRWSASGSFLLITLPTSVFPVGESPATFGEMPLQRAKRRRAAHIFTRIFWQTKAGPAGGAPPRRMDLA